MSHPQALRIPFIEFYHSASIQANDHIKPSARNNFPLNTCKSDKNVLPLQAETNLMQYLIDNDLIEYPMAKYSLKDKEGTIINHVREDFFDAYDCRDLIGNIDFSVAIPQEGTYKLDEMEYMLWAEAKQGDKHKLYESFIQLILTIGKERTFDNHMPPRFIGAFDAEKIAFIPYASIMEVFSQNDFNWNVTPSDHSSKEFQQLKQMVRAELDADSKKQDNVFVYYFERDEKELHRFIRRNFVSGRDKIHRMPISHNNFVAIYNKWRNEVMPTIYVNWEVAKKNGLLETDFYLADLIAQDNETLMDGLHVLLRKTHYELDRTLGDDGLFSSKAVQFKDGMKAHKQFWARYARPPKKEYWNKIVDRRDLLVPQDVRERKGSFYTPSIWVEKSQEYLADTLGENWQDEYYIWDCCAGTGNLLVGLTNKYRIWASTLDKADVKVMHERIHNGANLLESHVFQFDFLNDDFSQLPQSLQDVINDEEKRKKLVIYINPPYKEATNARTVTGTGTNQSGSAVTTLVYEKYKELIGKSIVELFAQFFIRIYQEIPSCTLAEFSTLKILQAPNFADFRKVFKARIQNAFVVPANTFDNVKGQFPIGFFIWDTKNPSSCDVVEADVYNAKGDNDGVKRILIADSKYSTITKWITQYKAKNNLNPTIGYQRIQGSDFQNNKFTCLVNSTSDSHAIFLPLHKDNVIPSAIHFSLRLCIEATWLNDRDQFFHPNDGWKTDYDFQLDCLAYTLFHGQNRISSEQGTNHWIPFTEQELNAPDNFQSHFMSDFIRDFLKGKHTIASSEAPTLFETDSSSVLADIPESATPAFSPEAAEVMEAGKALWHYYLHHKDGELYGAAPNINASFYDIRAYFQGRNEKGKMNSESSDEKYTALIKDLRAKQKSLAAKIAEKVYLYGFLK